MKISEAPTAAPAKTEQELLGLYGYRAQWSRNTSHGLVWGYARSEKTKRPWHDTGPTPPMVHAVEVGSFGWHAFPWSQEWSRSGPSKQRPEAAGTDEGSLKRYLLKRWPKETYKAPSTISRYISSFTHEQTQIKTFAQFCAD